MNEKKIWKKLLAAGMTVAGVAGLMGKLLFHNSIGAFLRKADYKNAIFQTAKQKKHCAS